MAPSLLPVSLRAECAKAATQFDSFANPTKGLDSIIPPSVLRSAAGLAILSVTRAGFLLNARAGSGLVIARTDTGFSAPSAIGLAGLGAGFSAGVELTELIIILNSRAAVKSFMATGSLTIGGNISIAAGPTGRSLEASGVASSKGLASMYSYSRTKGIYGGASIEGSVIVERSDANAKAYGFSVTAKDLLSGRVDPPDFAAHLIQTLSLRTGIENNWIAPDSDDDVAQPAHSANQPYSFGSSYATGGQGGRTKSRKNSYVAGGSGQNTPTRYEEGDTMGGSDYGNSYKKDERSRSSSLSGLANKLGRLGSNINRSPSPASPSSVTTPSSYPANTPVNANGSRSRSGSILRGISLPSFVGGSADKKSTTVTSSAEIYNETPDDVSKSYGAGMIKDHSSSAKFRETFVQEESSDFDSDDEPASKRYESRTPPAKKFPDYSPPANSCSNTSPFDDSAVVKEKPRKLIREGERNHAMKSKDRSSAAAMLTKPWDSEEDLMANDDVFRERKPTPVRKYSGGLDLTEVEVNFAKSSSPSSHLSPEPHRAAPPPPKFNRSLSNAPKIGTGIALYDYTGTEETDLSFRKGDIVSVLSIEAGGEWYRGRLKLAEGIFPANYVEYHAD